MIYLVASKRSVTLLATCDMDGQCTCYRAHIEDRCWQRVANTHQIADINQRIDTGNIAFFGQAAQQGLGCAAILCWLNAKFTERASPRGQRGYLAERRIADALKYGALFSLESLLQGLWRRPILHLFPVNHSAYYAGETLHNLRRVLEDHHVLLLQRHIQGFRHRQHIFIAAPREVNTISVPGTIFPCRPKSS